MTWFRGQASCRKVVKDKLNDLKPITGSALFNRKRFTIYDLTSGYDVRIYFNMGRGETTE